MKTCKKLFSLLLVAVMLVAAIPTFAFAAAEEYELIFIVDGVHQYQKGNRPTANIDPAEWGVGDGASSSPSTDGPVLLGLFGEKAVDGCEFTAAVVNRSKHMIRVEMQTKTHDHKYEWDGKVGDANGHTLACTETGCTESYVADHTYDTDGKCTVCGYEQPKTHAHDYKWDGKVGDANGHTMVCNVAGCTETTKVEAHTYDANGKCTVCGYEKPVTYTGLKIVVNGKTDITTTDPFVYNGTVDGDHAPDIFKAAGVSKSLDGYNVIAAVDGTQIVVTLTSNNTSNPTKITVSVINGSETKSYELEVGKYYYDYDFFTFANQDGRKFAALKVTDNAGYDRILSAGVKNDSAKVRSNDVKVTVQWNADVRKIEFMTDSTLSKVGTTRELYYGARLDSVGGTLPTTVGGKTVEYWTVWGSRIYDNTEYKWNADKVQAVPHFAGETGKVYLEIYANGNRTAKYSQLDITYLLQDGVIYRDRLTSAIETAVKTKNVKITGLFEESDWSSYVRNVNNVTNKSSVQIGTDNANARYLYVMVNGVNTKATDSTNPKTGDNVKLGVAAAVLAVAVVGFGAVIVVNKKKGVQ